MREDALDGRISPGHAPNSIHFREVEGARRRRDWSHLNVAQDGFFGAQQHQGQFRRDLWPTRPCSFDANKLLH